MHIKENKADYIRENMRECRANRETVDRCKVKISVAEEPALG